MFYVPDMRSSYVALVDHVAGADLDLDLQAQKLALVAKGGKDAVTFRGEWNTVLTYQAGDVVTVKVDPRAGYPWSKITARPSRGIEKDLSAKPTAGQVLRSIVNGSTPGGVYILKGGTGSYAAFAAAPASAYTFTVNRRAGGPGGTLTAIGTITWAAGATVGTWNIAAGVVVPAGDVIEFVFPAAQDANAAVVVMNMAIY